MTFDPEKPLSEIGPDEHVAVPEELSAWLCDLALLRGVPLSYLVPDEALLPAESIRFFHVDPTWQGRLIDGALSAASVGTLDEAIALVVREGVRRAIAVLLYQRAGQAVPPAAKLGLPPMSGFLLRSGLVRRWPTLEVRGYEKPSATSRAMPVLRQERLSDALLLVLFFGVPRRVEVWEPAEGTRFGVEIDDPTNADAPRSLGVRAFDRLVTDARKPAATLQDVALRSGSARVLDMRALRDRLGLLETSPEVRLYPPSVGVASGAIALALQQTRFVQVFQGRDPSDRKRVRRLVRSLKKKAGGGT